MGVAVFKDDKMIAELNGLESICHLIVCGELKYCTLQINDPQDLEKTIDIKLSLSNKPKCNLSLINDSAYIYTNINLNVQILSASSNSDYSNNSNIETLESEINSYFQNIITDYLYKMSKQYNADIDGFGKYAVKYFSSQQKWDNYNWLNNYRNSFFKVNVKSKIKSSSNFVNG